MTTIAELEQRVKRLSRRVNRLIAENANRDAAWERRLSIIAKEATQIELDELCDPWDNLVRTLTRTHFFTLFESRNMHVVSNAQRCSYGKSHFDIVAWCDDAIIFTDVSTRLDDYCINRLLESLSCACVAFHAYSNYRFFGGGVFLRADSEAAQVAQRQGLFTILATGNGAVITNEADFAAKEW